MNTGLYDYLDIDEVISGVRGDLGIEESSTVYDSNIERWINDAVPEVDACDFYVKKPAIITIENNKADLPKGFRKLLGLRFKQTTIVTVTDSQTQTNISCYEIMYVDMPFIAECGCSPMPYMSNYLQMAEINDGQIVFHNLPDGVEEAEISYMGIPISNECLYFIPPDYRRALSAYARMRFYSAYPEVKTVQFSMAMMKNDQLEWEAQKKLLKAKAAKRDFDLNKYFIRAYFKAWFVRQNKVWI